MDTGNHVWVFAAALVLARFVFTQATGVFEHPEDATVAPNVWANFSCTVHCSLSPVEWYKAGHPHPINEITGGSIDGLNFTVQSDSKCTSENKTIYFLNVLATKKFHNSAFYCAGYESCIGCPQTECKCGCYGRCYSRPALLRVQMVVPTVTSPQPTPTPSHTSMRQETASAEAMTKTVTVTSTPTNCPTVTGSNPLQLGESSSQAVSAQTTFLAGLGIAASIFLL